MKKVIFYIIFVSVIVLSSNCEKISSWDNRLKLYNGSSKAVYWSFHFRYPDTSIGDPNPGLDPLGTKVNPGETEKQSINGTWEERFNNRISSDTLLVFVFDADTIEHVDWQKVKSEYKILKRYKLTYEDLKQMNWIIKYP